MPTIVIDSDRGLEYWLNIEGEVMAISRQVALELFKKLGIADSTEVKEDGFVRYFYNN